MRTIPWQGKQIEVEDVDVLHSDEGVSIYGRRHAGMDLGTTGFALRTLLERSEQMSEKKTRTRAVVLLSGGIDSTTLMYALVEKYEVWPLSIDYGQKHVRELQSARDVCLARGDWLLQRWQCFDLSNFPSLVESVLTGKGDVPEGAYDVDTIKVMVVPNRNMIFLSLAAGYAESIGAEYVAYAAHHNDAAVYPDCRPEFAKSVAETIQLGTGGNVSVLAPFIHFTKAEIVKLGKGLNVPFQKTWSCYKGEALHCGACPTCIDRKQAFKLAGVKDPTEYVK
jgi:7-cyano-7-deazaguanine synthase